MNIEVWFTYVVLPLAAMTLVPLGVFVHYWRAADAHLISRRPDSGDDSDFSEWPAAARAQLARARVASALVAAAVLASAVHLSFALRSDPDGDGYLAPMLSVLLCTAVLLIRPAAMGRPTGGWARGSASPPEHVSPPSAARWWFVVWGMALSALMLAVVWAGLLSEPDEHGRYMVYTIRLDHLSDGVSVSGSTSMAGWYFGVPIILAAILLAVLVLIGVHMQNRAALAPDSGRDLHLRRTATRTLLTLSGGAFVATLGWVLGSIGGAARITAGIGEITVSSPLAPIAAPVSVLGMVLEGVGIALLLLPLFTRLPRSAGVSVHGEYAVLQSEQGPLRGDTHQAG
ncbi:hypothetical protein ASC66_01835 [Leifsonia sp. Root4]|uniref:hypothetical protein n=1 Tax=Leifsonia sp. Root4 TaxID=1736525 RepID=UPI00071454B9|nr:hypothetical protein [Leifsonia sp. Root4]KQW07746.1 hypothetical protein ASC66_01835 [Leifsonia sp. Root4]